jgi:A/G-specific adenine glycosylase
MGFPYKLFNWYGKNKRDLPWRKTTDPYQIWLSEVILQQTKVEQGLNYFNKFIEKYPTVELLAKASENEVLNLWQGLGYYSRARNLHFTSKYIVDKYNGVFPENYNDILKLKGVGEYTAAAIASFSYGLCYPVIDGNVYRVLARVFGVDSPIDSGSGKNKFKKLAEELIDKKNPATYNQAIMEFGALQCKPKNPDCENCPFIVECYAFKNKRVNYFPVKKKKIKQRNRYFNYLVVINKEKVFLKKRNENDIWKGLFDFPLIETNKAIHSFKTLVNLSKPYNLSEEPSIILKNKSKEYKHILSHQKIYATFWLISGDFQNKLKKNLINPEIKQINDYPVPKLIENYLKTTF